MSKRWPLFVSALIMPLVGMAYLYSRNAEYLSAVQVLVLSAAMMLLSALGYAALRLLFRSSASAMAGCLVAWVAFFAFVAGLADQLRGPARSFLLMSILYACATVLLMLAAAFAMRRYKGGALGMIALTMASVMLLLNAIPAVTAANLKGHGKMNAVLKTEFTVDKTLPSPNVYWIHADGMLGVSAMKTYFGNDQEAFLDALDARGFMVNEDAYFEAAHATVIAVPSLLCPAFYDEIIAPNVKTHEAAMALGDDRAFAVNESLDARVQNETRLAFEAKGYESQTLSMFGTYYPPVTDRFYMTDDSRGAYRLSLNDAESTFESIVELRELCVMLKIPQSVVFRALLKVNDQLNLGIKSEQLDHALTGEARLELMEGSKDALKDAVVFDALNDALLTQQTPTLTMVFFLETHDPYEYQADGSSVTGDKGSIENYAGNHEYSSKLLINMVDMILARDPDAVIVIQSDHGPHTSRRDAQMLQDKYGEEGLHTIWNQPMSAVLVPEQYQNGEEGNMMRTPLNISRYLMNRFVGERYAYLEG